ncbi:MAG: ATP-binding protein [Planctomycetota bacterium]
MGGVRVLLIALAALCVASGVPRACPHGAARTYRADEELTEWLRRQDELLRTDPQKALDRARRRAEEALAGGEPLARSVALSAQAEATAFTAGPTEAAPLLLAAEEALPPDEPLAGAALELARLKLLTLRANELGAMAALDRLRVHVAELPVSAVTVRAALWDFAIAQRLRLREETDARLSDMRELVDEAEVRSLLPWVKYLEHEELWLQGRVEEARALLDKLLEGAADGADPRLEQRLLYSLAWMQWEVGGNEAGLETIDGAVRLARELGDKSAEAGALELRACILRDLERLEEGMESIRLGLDVVDGRGLIDVELELCSTGSDIAALLDDSDAVLELTRAFDELESWTDTSEGGPDVRLARYRIEKGRADELDELDELRDRWAIATRLALAGAVVMAAAFLIGRRRLARINARLREEMAAARASQQAQQELEGKMRQLERLQGLGLIAGGVAHDFNNLLVGVVGNSELLRRRGGLTPEQLQLLGRIDDAAGRAAQLCQRLLAYAGEVPVDTGGVELNELVDRMRPLLETSVSQGARIEVEPSDTPAWSEGDSTQIEQALLNLVTNSHDAKATTIRIRIRCEELDAARLADLRLAADARPGAFVMLAVEDDGEGMDEATLKHIFDPFFTTRFPGRGLGLAALFGIVRGHSGAIDAASEPGRGTAIRIYLPGSDSAAKDYVLPAQPPPPWRPPERDAVLVVDDEASVHTTLEGMLGLLGLRALYASSTATALERAERHVGELGFVLLDETMPGGDGHEILPDLRALLPGVPVLMMSGHREEEVLARCGASPPDGWISKPFSIATLREQLQRGSTGAEPEVSGR